MSNTTPILVALDFNKSFVVEYDALGTIIGAVITYEGRPLAFTSQDLSGRNWKNIHMKRK